jgi:hypothetical protein
LTDAVPKRHSSGPSKSVGPGGGFHETSDARSAGPGADTFESYWSSLQGTYCSLAKDFIDGNDGVDKAKASRADCVTRVESVTRVTAAY